jgi:hypothetical protein
MAPRHGGHTQAGKKPGGQRRPFLFAHAEQYACQTAQEEDGTVGGIADNHGKKDEEKRKKKMLISNSW